MELGTDYVTPGKRIAENDFRASNQWTERPDEGSPGDGWTWVAALLVAALFIVSGYLDQESGIVQTSSASSAPERYASSSASLSSPNTNDRGTDKGY